MNTTNYIRIFRGDDSDALGYQTIVGTIKTDLDLTGCKAVFRFLGFYAEFDPIPEDKKLTIVIPAQASRGFPPGVGYASLKVLDALGKIRTFTNRIPVIVDTMTPSCGCGEFEVSFSPFPELEPLKIFVGPNADDFDQYTGFISKIIDRASLAKYGLVILADAMGEDGGDSGKAASPAAVKAAYDAIIKELTDNYYTAEQTDEAIDKLAAYYITADAQGNPFATHAALVNAQTYYSGGSVRIPTRNDYAVVSADEMHGGAEWRYIYAVDAQGVGQWEPQYAVEGVIAYDDAVTRTSANGVKSSGIWSAIWGALSALPTGFASLYDWCVSQLAGKMPSNATGADIAVSGTDATKISAALAGKASKADATLTERGGWNIVNTPLTPEQKEAFLAESEAASSNDYAVTIRGHSLYVGEYYAAGLNPSADGLSLFYYIGSTEANRVWGPVGTTVATRTALQGYQLGNDDQHILASEAEAEALRTEVAGKLDKTDVVTPSTSASDSGKAAGAKATGDALASKLDKSGGTMTGLLKSSAPLGEAWNGFGVNGIIGYYGGIHWGVRIGTGTNVDYPVIVGKQGNEIVIPSSSGTMALAAPDPTVGNLAALDANGNPTDSLIPAANVALKGNIPYDLVTKSITNGAVSLDDRAINAVAVSSSLASLTVNFPTATSGKARDFGLRLTVASGITTAPELALPQGVTCENADGEAPEIGADGAATILYFTETASGVFLVKGEVVTAIS